jgi:glycosyltransferase involved in cell wall biosynthesis
MRYVWNLVEEYFRLGRRWWSARIPLRLMVTWLRRWDVKTAAGVDAFIANPTCVQDRICRIYGRESTVIHPPADAGFFTPSSRPREDWYLCASAFAPYRRADLAIEAFRESGRRLKVVGAGQDEKRIRNLAGGSVEVLGWLPDEKLREAYRRCRALVFPGEEDFGIVQVEAQLCGTPVVAYRKGGMLDSVVAGVTGVFFREQTAEPLNAAAAGRDPAARGAFLTSPIP